MIDSSPIHFIISNEFVWILSLQFSNFSCFIDETAYNAKRFKEVGYYYDALTGREVEINFTVDPKDYEIATLGF